MCLLKALKSTPVSFNIVLETNVRLSFMVYILIFVEKQFFTEAFSIGSFHFCIFFNFTCSWFNYITTSKLSLITCCNKHVQYPITHFCNNRQRSCMQKYSVMTVHVSMIVNVLTNVMIQYVVYRVIQIITFLLLRNIVIWTIIMMLTIAVYVFEMRNVLIVIVKFFILHQGIVQWH